jgi:hypothetical protein
MKACLKNCVCPFKIMFLFIAIFLLSGLTTAQTILLQETPNDKPVHSFGMNQKWYVHLYLGYGFVAGRNDPGSEIIYGNSGGFRYGLRYKRKLNPWLSLGTDIGYHGTNYCLKQNANKTFPNTSLHKNEKLSTAAFEINIFSRFNFDGNRGDYMGKFLDLGIAYNRNVEIAQNTIDNLPNGNRLETTTTRLNYANKDTWLATARLGLNKYALTASYRLSPVFNTDVYKEFPNFIIGLEIGFY